MTPLLGAPTWWPARPTRCRPRATLVGDSTWIDEVDGAHVDAELEAARGDQRGESTGLELLLDLEALLARDAAVMRADEVLAGQLVEPLREPLAEAAAVGEDDRALVAADQLEDPRVDRGPDAGPPVGADGRAAGLLVLRQDLADGGHVVDRDDDLELERLACAGVDDRDLAVRAEATEEPGDRVERALGRAEPDALRGVAGVGVAEAFQALEAQREVGAAFRAGDRMDLVDDDVLDVPEDLARLAGEEQVQALRGRDQDVRRAAGDLAAVLAGGVTGAAGDGDVRRLVASLLGGQADAGQWGAQVALDVVGQGLERGDVEDPDVTGLLSASPEGWGRGRGGRARRGRRPASCRCRSGRG